MKCILHNTAEYKELNELVPNRLILDKIINDFQDEVGNDSYPDTNYIQSKLTELSESETQVEELSETDKTRYLSLLNQLGITYQNIEDYSNVTNTDIDSSIIAIADLSRKIVAVNEGKLNADTLPEEIGHFVISSSKDKISYQRALEYIATTEDYKEGKDNYTKKYKETYPDYTEEQIDELVKEEFLGQLFGQRLRNNFEMQGHSKLMRLFKRLWNSFKKLFANNEQTQIHEQLDNLVQSTLSGNITISPTEQVFFELESNQKENLNNLERLIDLTVRQWKSRKRGFIKEGKKDKAELVQTRINMLLDNNETNGDPNNPQLVELNGHGLIKFFESFQIDLNQVKAFFRKVKEGERKLDTRTLANVSEFIAYYEPFLDDLKSALQDPNVSLPEDIITEITKILNSILADFSDVKAKRNAYREQDVANILDKEYARELKLDINDPNFREQVIEKLEFNPYKEIKVTHTDSSEIGFWFGPLRDASDQLLRTIHIKFKRLAQKIFREVLDYGKDVLQKFNDIAYSSQDWMAEKVKGKFTGYFKQPFNKRGFKAAKDDFTIKINKKYNLSSDYDERKRQVREDLSPAAKKAYNKEWTNWFDENTQRVSKVKSIVNEMITYYGQEIADHWLKSNQVSKGYVPAKKWMTDYSKLKKDQKVQLGKFIQEKWKIDKEIVNRMQKDIDPFQMVQISVGMGNIVTGPIQDLFRRLGKNIKESFIKRADDLEFGEDSELRPDGSVKRFIPLRFINILEDPDTVSTDVIGTLILYKNMWENYKEKTKALPEFQLLQEQVGERKLDKKGKITEGTKTTSYKRLEKFLDMNLNEQRKQDLEVTILGKKRNITKPLNTFANYVRNNNLIFSFATMVSNYISSKTFSIVEALVGEYTNKKSALWATGEYYRNLPALLKELAAKSNQSENKVRLLMEYGGLVDGFQNIFGNLNRKKLTRRAIQSGAYFGYELGDFFVKSKLMLSVLHNSRMYNNKFVSLQEYYKEKGIDRKDKEGKKKAQEEFYKLKSAYDLVKVKDKKLDFKFPKEEFDKLVNKTQFIANQIDGKLTQEDYAAIHQHAIFSLVSIHRNWLFSGVYRRFKAKGYNFETGGLDQGYFMATKDFLSNTFFSKERIHSLKELAIAWDHLKPHERMAVRRTIFELGAVFAFGILAKMINRLEEDEEDDWYLSTAAYLSNRALLEVSAFVNPSEYINAISNPFVPLRNIEYMMDINELFNSDVISKGPWEGFSHRDRFFYRLMPGLKGLIMARDPHYGNEFLKQKPLKLIYN